MNINEFLEIVEEFFDLMHPNFCDDYVEDINKCQLWTICDDFFQQIGPQV